MGLAATVTQQPYSVTVLAKAVTVANVTSEAQMSDGRSVWQGHKVFGRFCDDTARLNLILQPVMLLLQLAHLQGVIKLGHFIAPGQWTEEVCSRTEAHLHTKALQCNDIDILRHLASNQLPLSSYNDS